MLSASSHCAHCSWPTDQNEHILWFSNQPTEEDTHPTQFSFQGIPSIRINNQKLTENKNNASRRCRERLEGEELPQKGKVGHPNTTQAAEAQVLDQQKQQFVVSLRRRRFLSEHSFELFLLVCAVGTGPVVGKQRCHGRRTTEPNLGVQSKARRQR